MGVEQKAFDLIQQQHWTIDEILADCGLDHATYRRWLSSCKHELYKLTPGMATEIMLESGGHTDRKELAWRYKCEISEINYALYSNGSSNSREFIQARVKALNEMGHTQEYIGQELGISQANVNQHLGELGLHKRAKYKKRVKLTDKKAKEIAKYEGSVEQAMLKFNVSRSTVFKCRREFKQ